MTKIDVDKITVEIQYKANLIKKVKGTFGLVYIFENEQYTYPKFFACKTINPQKLEKMPKDDAIRKFVHEVRQWYNYGSHPLILCQFYIDIINGLPYITMPFCDKNLRDYIEERRDVDVIEAIIFGTQICKSLLYCKKRGLEAHQDLKLENVLMKDMSKTHPGFPPENVHNSLKWRILLSDFGLANAWKVLGLPHGSRPFMAPEQYKKESDFSKVDIFAIGVILTELFTGNHPIGEKTSNLWPEPKMGYPRKYKHEDVWIKWANSKEKNINFPENVPNCIQKIIKRCLEPAPQERVELEEIYKTLMEILEKLDKDSSYQLKILLEWYDKLSEEELKMVGMNGYKHIQLSKISTAVMEIEMKEIEDKINAMKNLSYMGEYETSTFLENLFLLGNFCLQKKQVEKVLSIAKEMRDFLVHQHHTIKASVNYLGIKEIRDIEVIADYIKKIFYLFNSIQAEKELSNSIVMFEKDNVLHSALLLHEASSIRNSDVNKAVELLTRAKAINTQEPIFDYFIKLWIEHDVILKRINK